MAEQPAVPTAAEAEAVAASLTLLQRGVDLLNVSRVPRKIAETNEQLGLPHVHVGFDSEIVAVTFMWSMGWYRFQVDLDSGDVGMEDRGYEELTLQPNAGVRADGTVQLAPAQISRAAAAQRTQAPPEPAPEPAAAAPPPRRPRSPRPRVRPRKRRRSSSASRCSGSAATTSPAPGSRRRPATSTGTAEPQARRSTAAATVKNAEGPGRRKAPRPFSSRQAAAAARVVVSGVRTTCRPRRPSCRRAAGS